MNALIWLALVSFGLSLILTPAVRAVCSACGLVDHPDQYRKTHKLAVPRVGGIALAVSYVASVFLVQWGNGLVGARLALAVKILPAACAILIVGVVDDLWGLKAWQKLLGQVMAAGIACMSGVLAVDVMGVHGREWWTIPVTILWLVVCANGFNLVDGMDGLAAGAGLFATLTIFAAAMMQKNVALAMATAPLAGCLLGFLRYNFNPATIFLGDSGSLFTGFLLGCYAIIWREKATALLGMTAPLMAFSLPLLDVALAIGRRLLRRQSIFSGDREHIHHRLLARGMSPRKVALLLYGICGVAASFSLVQSAVRDRAASSVIVLLFCGVAWAGIRYLGYTEFSLARKMIFGGGLQRNLRAELDLTALLKSFDNASTIAEVARLVREGATRFGVVATRMRLAGEDFGGMNFPVGSPWEARVTLGAGDWVEFARIRESDALAGSFLDTLAASLEVRIKSMRKERVSSPLFQIPASVIAPVRARGQSASGW